MLEAQMKAPDFSLSDKDAFIGIITRRSIILYCKELLFPED